MNIIQIISDEKKYQQKQLKLIPSENYTSPEVLNAVGSVLMNKYAEGYPGRRYYQGNTNIDKIETTCRNRALQLFKLDPEDWHVNVQAVTGSIANLAVYNAVLEPGDKIMGMSLPYGGHLSHGWKLSEKRKVSFTSKVFESEFYTISDSRKQYNYEEIRKKAQKFKPKIIISGGTAVPRNIDHKKMSKIAKEVGSIYLADIAHEAGLIAAEVLPSPFEYADFVTMTTRKTLRGPIGSLIFTRTKFAKKLDKSIFPGLQGGPMINSIAGIAIALKQAQNKKFKKYARQVIENAKELSRQLQERNFKIISGGTDKHLILIDIRNKQPDGLIAAKLLEEVDIILNKNSIPQEENEMKKTSPWRPPGIRLGTPSITTRGMKKKEMEKIAELIDKTLSLKKFHPKSKASDIEDFSKNNKKIQEIKKMVHRITNKFPIYNNF